MSYNRLKFSWPPNQAQTTRPFRVRRPTSKGQETAHSNSHTAVAVVLLSIPFSLSGVLVNWYWWYQPRTWEVFWFSLHQTFATPIWGRCSVWHSYRYFHRLSS